MLQDVLAFRDSSIIPLRRSPQTISPLTLVWQHPRPATTIAKVFAVEIAIVAAAASRNSGDDDADEEDAAAPDDFFAKASAGIGSV